VKVISESISTLPVGIYQRDGQTVNRLDDHRFSRILTKPNEYQDFQTLREVLMMNALLWGNGIAEKVRDRNGAPIYLRPIMAKYIQDIKLLEGQKVFVIEGREKPLLGSDVLHIMGPTIDGICGLSVIDYHARTIGLGVTSQEFNKKFYERGGFFKGFLQLAGVIGKDSSPQQISQDWDAKWGGPNNMFTTPVLQNGMDYKSVSLPQRDAQTLEIAKFNVEDVARIFGVPLPKLKAMDKTSYNSLEQENIAFVTDTLRVWAKKWEYALDQLMVPEIDKGAYFRVNLEGLLRGDSKSRSDYYWRMVQMGAMSPNEVRALENMNPREDGDIYLTPTNMITNEQLKQNENA
jgi:HK97 family phage portal protein